MKKRVEDVVGGFTDFKVTELDHGCLRHAKGGAANCVCIDSCNGVCGCGRTGNCICNEPKAETGGSAESQLSHQA